MMPLVISSVAFVSRMPLPSATAAPREFALISDDRKSVRRSSFDRFSGSASQKEITHDGEDHRVLVTWRAGPRCARCGSR
jgi:hypothetical protein